MPPIQETVSAFANTNPEGGLLVIGISQKGEVRGINHLTDNQRNDISRIGHFLRNQSALVRWQDCTDCYGDANRLLLIFVPETRDAICETLDAMPKAWKRAGAQNIPLTGRNREQLRRDKRLESFERRFHYETNRRFLAHHETGFHASTNRDKLSDHNLLATFLYFRTITIIAFDEQAQTVFNRLRAQKPRVGTLDLRIAAIP